MVGLLLAVGMAALLAIILSAAYALVLCELRQINANLQQLIELTYPKCLSAPVTLPKDEGTER